MNSPDSVELFYSAPRFLVGESADQFASLHAELVQEIKPNGAIEKIHVNDMAALVRDILRLRRIKTAIIPNARHRRLINRKVA